MSEKLDNILGEMQTKSEPYTVIFCGDKSTAIQFEEVIIMELKRLRPNSLVLHGYNKGVDYFISDLAKQLNVKTEILEPSKMFERKIDMVFAFHPDICFAEEIKKLILKAWKQHIPVFVHDLKRKSKFEGDFDNL